MRGRILVGLGAVVAAVMTAGGTAVAGHLGTVKSYTGCLVPGDGNIIKLKEGDAPKSACTSGQSQVHLSGGDITRISVTGALAGGGDNGEVTIGLKPEFTLPSGCTSGQVAKWDSTGWGCAADNDTTYSVSTGLQLIGTAFSIAPTHRVKNTPDCPTAQFAIGFDSDGDIQCAAPTATGLQTFQARQASYLNGDGVPDDGVYRPYVTLPVPAGTYVITGKAVLEQGDDDVGFTSPDDDELTCRLGNLPGEYAGFNGKDNDEDEYPFALTGVVTTSSEAITLQCRAPEDFDLVSVRNATLVALKVG